jgi:hypothetical protein
MSAEKPINGTATTKDMPAVEPRPTRKLEPIKHGKSLVGFYVALGVVAALVSIGTILWKPLHRAYSERAVTRAFLKAMDQRVYAGLKDVPAEEGLQYMLGMLDVSVVTLPSDDRDSASWPRVTLEFSSVPIAAVLDSWCRQTGLDWTIASFDYAPTKRQVVIADPRRIAELERANPWAASLVRQYRKELAAKEQAK